MDTSAIKQPKSPARPLRAPATQLLFTLNKLFKAPVHPFNLETSGEKTYAMWQFEKGANTIQFFQKKYTNADMFQNKIVVDIGCGAAGKSLYYASCGAKKVIGIDHLEQYRTEAYHLAGKLHLKERFAFLSADAAHLPLEDACADTVIMNDAMEHMAQPEAVLREALRVLAPGGRLYVNFPPYYHPYGAHLSDAISIPWVHLFFKEATLIDCYKTLLQNQPDAQHRLSFRISKNEDGQEYFSYINHMTIKRFKKILNTLNLVPAYYHQEPLRKPFLPLAHLPWTEELFSKMVVCVIEKQ